MCGCATLPAAPGPQALYVDLYKAVELSEDGGWVVDRVQFRENLQFALRTVCQTTPEARRGLRVFLDQRIAELGGPARLQYAQNGHDLSALGEVLSVERTAALLDYAEKHLKDCPFYLQPTAEFSGVEGDNQRWVMWLESQGYGAVLFNGDKAALSGGGSGRILVGYGLSPRVTVAVGADLGGSGTLINQQATSERLDTALSIAAPIALRFQSFSRFLEVDLAPVVRFNAGEKRWPPGLRATVGVGGAAMRKGPFMPYLMLWVAVEHHLPAGDIRQQTSLRVGTRVGVDFGL